MIPAETIALVRERTNIVAVIQESVPSLKRRGRSWVGLCPFHKEKTPSFHVNPDRGFFHCFGCQESGSAIDFVMKHDGLTFPEAVRALAERCGIDDRRGARAPRPRSTARSKARDDLYSVDAVAATFYERELREHPDQGLRARGAREARPVPAGARSTTTCCRPSASATRPPRGTRSRSYLKAQGISPALAEQVGPARAAARAAPATTIASATASCSR